MELYFRNSYPLSTKKSHAIKFEMQLGKKSIAYFTEISNVE
jgi:hypothetical protein